MREFAQKQAERRRKIQAQLRAMEKAEKEGTYRPQDFPPLYD